MIKKYKAELKIMGVPAYYIINDISYPEEATVESTGEKFWMPLTIWGGFTNKKLHDETAHLEGKAYDKKRKEIESKDESTQCVVVAGDYQLPFSETGFRSNIFDKKETEKVTKENLKQWIIEEALFQLGVKPSDVKKETPAYAEHSDFLVEEEPVIFVKEVKFNKKKDDI